MPKLLLYRQIARLLCGIVLAKPPQNAKHFDLMKTLFKTFIILAAALTLASCGTMKLTTEEKQELAESIQNSINEKKFEIDINMMNPMRGRSRRVTGFSVLVQGDTLISHLPYFGEARSIPYGGGTGLNFEEEIESYNAVAKKDDCIEVDIVTRHEGDKLTYNFDIYDNGTAYLTVTSYNRDNISYTGYIKTAEQD
jgi:predicted small secreted protein